MNVELSTDLQMLAESLIASGRFSSIDEVLREGVQLLASQERLRQQVEIGVGQADRGEIVDHDSVFSQLRMMAGASQDIRNPQ
jgi:antitoxin ParD1/3/4